MTSTPDDGESQPHQADQAPDQIDLPDETQLSLDQELATYKNLDTHRADGEVLSQFAEQDDSENTLEYVSEVDGVDPDGAEALPTPVAEIRVQSPSTNDNISIPDDTPSLPGSILSSPRSATQSPGPIDARNKSMTPRRPFDLRFQSRLSSSSLTSPRASSPAFLGNHSRQSSLASFAFQSASEPDDSAAPWEVIRWHRLSKLTSQAFSETARRNFGSPTCLAVTDHIIVGTSRGIVLVFDHQQNHKAIIGSGSKAAECGAVSSLAISADHTTIAAGHATGHIFTWEIGRSTRPFLHIPPIDHNRSESRPHDGHVNGSRVLHVGFLGFRRTALVSADDRGMAFSHLASRGTGALGRTVKTTRILGRYPELLSRAAKPVKKSSVLAFSPLPLGNIEQSTDPLGLVAMLTPYLLVIVSTTPVAQTQHKAARPKEVAEHSAMTAALAWFPAIKLRGDSSTTSKSKLAYAWSDVLTVLEVHEVVTEDETEKDKPPELQFLPRSRYKAEEAIVAVQWLSRSVIAVLTITQQLLIIEDVTMNVTDAFDLLPKDLYHADVYSHQLQAVVENLDEEDISMHGVVADAYHMSFRAYKGRLFLLGHKSVWWGSLTNWADRLLAMMGAGDYIGAIRLATNYYAGTGEKLTIGLPEDDEMRTEMVRGRLLEMIRASLKHAFGQDDAQLLELAVASVAACLIIDDQDFLFDEIFAWYDDHKLGALFVDVLEPHILDGKVTSLPPAALKVLINHFVVTHTPSKLEEIICMLDPTSMDIDQVTNLCKQNNLFDAYIYVWNSALMDYTSPLQEMLEDTTGRSATNGYHQTQSNRSDLVQKIFAYISFVLTGRVYPTELPMAEDIAANAKLQIYDFLFSGKESENAGVNSYTAQQNSPSEPYSNLRAMLHIDASSFMSALNEAFEDSFLNRGSNDDADAFADMSVSHSIYHRQLLVQILLGVMSSGFDYSERIYLDMFIARSLPKYPQYLTLKGTELDETFTRLCRVHEDEGLRDDAQLSVEYLLSAYQPPDVLSFVPVLRTAQFYRVLKSVLKQEKQYAQLVETYFLDPEQKEIVFDVVVQCLRASSSLDARQREEVIETVTQHALDMCDIDVVRTARVIDSVLPEAHQAFIDVLHDTSHQQYYYLKALLEPEQATFSASERVSPMLLELYVRLMCQYEPAHVVVYIRSVSESDLKLEAVIPVMETSGVIDAAVTLLAKQGQVGAAMDRLIKHISALQSALTGILDNAADTPDEVGTNEAIEDLVESIDRYAGVGTWVCQGQSKANTGPRSAAKTSRKSATSLPLSFEEILWRDLLVAVVGVAQSVASIPTTVDHRQYHNLHEADEISASIRLSVQKVFTALLSSTSSAREGGRSGNDFTFLRILRAFLSSAAASSPTLSQLRSVIASIFSAYAYEESLLGLSNAMLDKDLFVHVEEVAKMRVQGWRPRGQVCEICRRRVWGPGTGNEIWSAWEKSEQARKNAKRRLAVDDTGYDDQEDQLYSGKGKAAASHRKDGTSTSGSVPASSSDTGDENEDVAMSDEVDGLERGPQNKKAKDNLGPVVVFSCRHLYHRACLVRSQDTNNDGDVNTRTDAGVENSLGIGIGVGTGASAQDVRLQCPSCP